MSAPLAIVGWYDEDGAHLSSWIGETEQVRVRNFDPDLGLENPLTEDDIVTEGGTVVVIFKRDKSS